MKYSVAAVAALAGAASASPAPRPLPFELVLSSTDKSVDGQKISACHAGAAIQATCVGKNGVTFYTNHTGAAAPVQNIDAPAYITYDLPTTQPIPLKLNLVKIDGGNTYQGILEPTKDGAVVDFTYEQPDEQLTIYSKDGKPTFTKESGAKLFSNWYVCENTYAAYTYNTLSWVEGDITAKPSGKSCKKVKVIRKFLN